jgi:hypothetical protein
LVLPCCHLQVFSRLLMAQGLPHLTLWGFL